MALFYAEAFSEDELEGLIEFYKSDLGEKYLAVLPAINQASFSYVVERFFMMIPEFERAFEMDDRPPGERS